MSDERRLQILRAIVQDYVSTSEPVGSKALLERHQLGVSAATVRNDMAALEDDGLIVAPHTSAGRVPTDAGYRVFVDRLTQLKRLSRAERSAIEEFLSQAVDLDDVVDRTTRLLASLTQQVAVMQYPSLSRSTVQHVELVPVAGRRLMLVLILSSGRVEQRMLEGEVDVDTEVGRTFLTDLRDRLNELTGGMRLPDAQSALAALPAGFEPDQRSTVQTVLDALRDLLSEQREERVVLAGTSNLARPGSDVVALGPVLEALEEHVVLLRLVDCLTPADVEPDIAVRIGHENTHQGLQGTSVVTTSYGSGGVAGLGVLGPTRMDYPSTMAAVRAVARYVSEMLEQ